MLLDIPSVITSEQFAYVNPQAQMAYRTFVQRENDGQRLQDKLIDHLNDEEDRRFYQNTGEDGFIAPESDIYSKEEEEEQEQETNETNDLPVYNLEDIQKGVGYLMPVTFKNGDKTKGKDPIRMLIPKVAMYANRGFGLRKLNLIEYIALIEKREKASTTNTKNKCFEFPPSFVCAAEYDQVLCMKQKTVIVIGKSPRHPGKRPR
jgi:hypothetical protein